MSKFLLGLIVAGLSFLFFSKYYCSKGCITEAQQTEKVESKDKSPLTLKDIGFQEASNPVSVEGLAISQSGQDGTKDVAFKAGKAMMIHFWAPWCPPCRSEMPHFAKFVAEHKDVVLWCPADGEQTHQNIEAFFQSNKIEGLPNMVDQGQKLASLFGVDGIPTTVFVDANGREKGRVIGTIDWADSAVADLVVNELLS